MRTKELEDITVNDITNHCGASRSVFYRHFRDKYDLATWVYERFIREFFSKISKYKGQNSFSEFFIKIYVKSSIIHINWQNYYAKISPLSLGKYRE